ncbi:MAG: 4Fe-4S dicluster domain-containing protein [Acidobacteria bacterium]|uniref:4Fe-4S dicluster domain-containing protein n=1 Tax=Candidatus Polarisedimenticola svalbardensis TaxID=2886004 RepID=A0A8J7CCQ9_9BACT|nr:4Fe-4S dicluster domain-containing protein [Candidatus Polarisedimenticola svalbardensis]
MFILEPDGFEKILDSLREKGYRITGPKLRDGAIVLDTIDSAASLPRGVRDHQGPGRYRLEETGDDSWFSYTLGSDSWKKLFFHPIKPLFKTTRDGGLLQIEPEPPREGLKALIGVRPCELQALAIQDKVLAEGEFVDRHYVASRKGTFIVAVNCTVPGGTCFCVSMGTGPVADRGYDISLTELGSNGATRFVARAGSPHGEELLAAASSGKAGESDLQLEAELLEAAAGNMGRSLDVEGLAAALAESGDHPRWEEVAERCQACTNCTMACPTCYCHTVEDSTDLTGSVADRTRVWDSCFTADHSYLHGGSVRETRGARYRQWLTHKLSSWHDQFGGSGCTGCGRCITWCPVGIDITEEAQAVRGTARG